MRRAISIKMNQALASFVMLLSLVLTTRVSEAETALRDADIQQATIDTAVDMEGEFNELIANAPDVGAQTAGAAQAVASQCGRLKSGEYLSQNQSVTSCSGNATLVHQSDGNVVEYNAGAALWASAPYGKATSNFGLPRSAAQLRKLAPHNIMETV